MKAPHVTDGWAEVNGNMLIDFIDQLRNTATAMAESGIESRLVADVLDRLIDQKFEDISAYNPLPKE